MATRLTEFAVEELAAGQFEWPGYMCIHAPDIAPDGVTLERRDYVEVLLQGRLEQAARRITSKPLRWSETG